MMKQQQYATKKHPGKLCKFLLILVGFKLCLLAVLLMEPSIDFSSILSGNSESSVEVKTYAIQEGSNIELAEKTSGTLEEQNFIDEYAYLDPALSSKSSTAEQTKNSSLVAPINLSTGLTQPDAFLSSQSRPKTASGVAYAASLDTPTDQENQLALEALRKQQEELSRKEQSLKALQAELDARLHDLQEVEMRLNAMLQEANDIKSAKYRQLIDVFSNMKARQAAQVLETLDEKIAVKVLAGMRGRQAGEILSLANAEKAARLAESLARLQMPLE